MWTTIFSMKGDIIGYLHEFGLSHFDTAMLHSKGDPAAKEAASAGEYPSRIMYTYES